MKDHNSVFLAWRSPKEKEWHVVGMLVESKSNEESLFTFKYTKGAIGSADFIPFRGMEDIKKVYKSENLFPLFNNRLLSKKRPEYPTFLEWLGLDDETSKIDLLGRSGGIRGTDQLQMFKRVEFYNDGTFEHIFFSHGLRHLSDMTKKRVLSLRTGEELFFCIDIQNDYDENAVLIRSENPVEAVGYCPRYLANDILSLLKENKNSVRAFVESISYDAPTNYQLMCKLKGKANKRQMLELMNREEYQPICTTEIELEEVLTVE